MMALKRRGAKRRPLGSSSSHRRVLRFEACEDRTLTTLVFLLNGNSLAATTPSILTESAAVVIEASGNQPVQINTPKMESRADLETLARQIRHISHGQPIGIVGFSAGGTEALRLSAIPSLHVVDVLDYYGPPDVRDYFDYHGGDTFAHYVEAQVNVTPPLVDTFSGPISTSAHVVAAFGSVDPNANAVISTQSLQKDLPKAQIYYYDGGHGVSILNCPPALADFEAHL